MEYYVINETEEGLAIIKDEFGNIHLPKIDKDLILADNKLDEDRYITLVGTLVFLKEIPENVPYQRINYDNFVLGDEYVSKATLLLRFASNFFR